MVDDHPLEPELREAAQAYHEPPGEPPRERMWDAIVAARGAGSPPIAGTRGRHSIWLAAGVAAALVIGIGIGRLATQRPASTSAPEGTPAAAAGEPRKQDRTAYRLAAAEHLGQAEAFLTLFRISIQQGRDQRLASATARQLLVTNRLLLDSPATKDPRLELLLQDLELVLVQIAQLEPSRGSEDLELIRHGLDDGMLARLRAAVPAGNLVSSRQGAL